MRILLVGASGRVGAMVLRHWGAMRPPDLSLIAQARRPVVPGALVWNPLEGPRTLVDLVARTGAVDAMVVLAGVTPGPGKDLSLNRTLAEACLRAAAEAGIGRVLLASSSAVYGAGDGTPFAEDMPCNPVNDYGRAKIDMEEACDRHRRPGLAPCCLRIGNVAGADALLVNIAAAGADEPVTIDTFDDGRGPARSYIGSRTMASVLQALCRCERGLPQVLNLAAPRPVAMEALARASGHPWTTRAAPPQAHQRITLDCGRLAGLYAFSQHDSDPAEMVRQWKERPRP